MADQAYQWAGKRVHREWLDNPLPTDDLLRWHFRQAVLTNTKGYGVVTDFEFQFLPGTVVMAVIRKSLDAAEWMEFELYQRLATQGEVF